MSEFIIALAAVFVTAGLLLLIANELGIPPVPTYIVAGLVSGTFVDQAALLELALWGIGFLVFVFGIRVDLGDLQSVLRDGERAAFTQLLVVAPIAVAIGYLLGTAFGFEYPVRNALYFGAAATLSSTLVGRQLREQEIRNNLVYGRLAATIHFFDDIVAIGAIVILSAEGLTNAQLVTSKIGYGVLFLLAGLVIYRHGYPLLIRATGDSDELILMGSISILIAFIAAAEAVGISIVVGAFAAGLAVRSGGIQSLGVQNGIESIKDFFAAIFFVTIGALVSVPDFEAMVLASVLVGLVLLVNPLVQAIAFLTEGYDGRTAFLAGTSLNQVSELSLVVAIQAWLLGTIAPSLFSAVILAAAVTMVISTVADPYENRLYDLFRRLVPELRTGFIDKHSSVPKGLSGHVVIVGLGRQTRRLMVTFEELEVPYVVVENDPIMLDSLQSDCQHYVFGDAMAKYPMAKAGVADAELLVSTADYRPLSESLLEVETDATVLLRADTAEEAAELLEGGATFVAVPGILAADNLQTTVKQVLDGEVDPETLETEHKKFLAAMAVREQPLRTDRA